MSLFSNNNAAPDPSEDRLHEWGDSERAAPPVRRGRFAGVADRLTRGSNLPTVVKPALSPFLVWGMASALTSAVACQLYSAQITQPTSPPGVAGVTQPENPPGTVRDGAIRKATPNTGAWDDSRLTPIKHGVLRSVSARVEPCFIAGGTFSAADHPYRDTVTPFVVTLKNNGAAFRGKIVVETKSSERTYNYPVSVAGGGAVTRTIVYPKSYRYSDFAIRLETASAKVTLDNPRSNEGGNQQGSLIAILDKRFGVLSPRGIKPSERSYTNYRTAYGKPWNAPERAAGYDAVDTLVLGYGCETLSAAQWSAIRAWVKDGGKLVLLGGTDAMRRVLQTPDALALSPILRYANKAHTASPRLIRFNPAISPETPLEFYSVVATHISPILTVAPEIRNDARVVLKTTVVGNADAVTVGATRPVGGGSVAFYGSDFTTPSLRSDPYAHSLWWNYVAVTGKGARSADFQHNAAQDTYLYATQHSASNPFFTSLPDLHLVLYVFLGYFVLVVPVSFVVLKQTRRLHYAWFTGPALAAVFAGGFALSSRSLYSAAQSVRTSGVISLEAGDGAARFHGVTELFVPKAGRVTLDIPGTEVVFNDDMNNRTGMRSSPVLATTDTGNGEQSATITVPNLSFQRIPHDQSVTLGTGITAAFRRDVSGSLSGTVSNNTGHLLRNAKITMRDEKTVMRDGATRFIVWQSNEGSFVPGTNAVVLHPSRFDKYQSVSKFNVFERNAASLPPRIPILTAKISGESFAPRHIGKWVGGDSGVEFVAKLPAVTPANMSTVSPRHTPVDVSPVRNGPPPGAGGAVYPLNGGDNR